jgi:hypothetical protein
MGRVAYAIANRLSNGKGVNTELEIKDASGKILARGPFAFTKARLDDLNIQVPENPTRAFWEHAFYMHALDILSRMLDDDRAPYLNPWGRLAIEHWGGRGARAGAASPPAAAGRMLLRTPQRVSPTFSRGYPSLFSTLFLLYCMFSTRRQQIVLM